MEKSKLSDFIDTEYSSGDSKMMKSKQKRTEENNNEVDELSKDFSEMGCIVDPVKRPSNVCVESCVYEGSDEEQVDEYEEAEGYSDEFEEDQSEDEELKLEPHSAKSETSNIMQNETCVKLTKSQSSMSTSSKPPVSMSGRSSGFGSVSVPPTRRVNMSFTNERLREIERHNHILLKKILTARNNRKSSIPPSEQPPKRPVPPAAVQRKQQQKKIDHENMILLKKIQRAKSSAYSMRR